MTMLPSGTETFWPSSSISIMAAPLA